MYCIECKNPPGTDLPPLFKILTWWDGKKFTKAKRVERSWYVVLA